MKKTHLSLLLAMSCLAGNGYAQTTQRCGADEMHAKYKQQNPKIAEIEKLQEEAILNFMKGRKGGVGARTTADAPAYYDIPVVVHVMHNYGPEVLADNQIYALIAEMNKFYSVQNDTSSVIKPFKKYVGNAKIRFHLATIDPNGNPTNGITRRRTYLTYGYDDQAKLDQWQPTSYFNIWFENYIGLSIGVGTVLAYATFPSSSVGEPYYDGVMSGYQYIADGGSDGGSTLDHESGHYFGLAHPWTTSGKGAGEACGDDGVDDTPPTAGHFSTCPIYDSACAVNYFKVYPDINGGDSLVNYPDTTNVQNVMDYSSCTNMLTKGQVVRMHATLNSTVAGRNNLWDSTNLVNTGALAARRDLKPIPEFAALPTSGTATNKANYYNRLNYFTFPGVGVKFVNETWNDTVASLVWTFSNSAASPTVTNTNPTINSTSVTNTFADPGWVTLSMKATGNGTSGDTTVTWPRALFVADPVATPALGYYQEFSGADTAKWPMFNYFQNNLHWEMSNSIGYDDHNCMKYVGYDDRLLSVTGKPMGDLDDLYSIPFDFTSFGSGPCSFNFYYSGASRSAMSLDINDTLEVSYSTNKSTTFTVLKNMTKGSLENKGAVSWNYMPFSYNDWDLFSMNLPTAAKTAYTVFRFRYKPSVKAGFDGTLATGIYSSSNNFYLDRITFSPWTAGVENVKMGNIDVAVIPNPTSSDAYVIIKDADNAKVDISVTDITGKVVYTTSAVISGNAAQVEIPKSSLSVSGMYLVRVITGNQVRTEKLIVQ